MIVAFHVTIDESSWTPSDIWSLQATFVKKTKGQTVVDNVEGKGMQY